MSKRDNRVVGFKARDIKNGILGRMTGDEVKVYLVLSAFADKKGIIHESDEKLVRYAGFEVDQMEEARKKIGDERPKIMALDRDYGRATEEKLEEETGEPKEEIEGNLKNLKEVGIVEDYRFKDGHYEWILNSKSGKYTRAEVEKAMMVMADIWEGKLKKGVRKGSEPEE